MNISSIYYQQNRQKCKPSFGQVRPEHMFINAVGFKKDLGWANNSVDIIKMSTEKISKATDFNSLIDFVAEKYHKLFDKFKDNDFGIQRISGSCFTVDDEGKYSFYKNKLKSLIDKNSTNYFLKDEYTMEEFLNSSNRRVELNKLYLQKRNTQKFDFDDEDNPLDYEILVAAPNVSVIKPVLNEVNLIYKKIFNKKETPTPSVIDNISKDVASIHWLLSQGWPYKRGSACIADIIAKTIFEAKGIQISSYKENINPNIEAFSLPLNKYRDEYKKFFSKPLEPIKTALS